MLTLLFLLTILAAGQAWVIESNLEEVTPDESLNLRVTCKQDNRQDGGALFLKTITRMRIVKLDHFGSKVTLADMRQLENTVRKSSNEIIATGTLDDVTTASLQIHWPRTSKTTPGAYGCMVDGYDAQGNFGSIQVDPKIIREKTLAMEEIKQLIKAATSGYEKKQRELESKISTLKADFQRDMSPIYKRLKDLKDKINTDISGVKDEAKLKYASKSELKTAISDLERSLRQTMASDNAREKVEHQSLRTMIQNVDQSSKAKYSELTTRITDVNAAIGSRVDALDKKTGKSIKDLKATLDGLQNSFKSRKQAVDNRIAELRRYFTDKIAKEVCPCPHDDKHKKKGSHSRDRD